MPETIPKQNSSSGKKASARVLMLEQRDSDLSNSLDFGSLVYLFTGNKARASVFDTGKLCNDIADKLQEMSYDPENDLIVLTGPFLAVIILMSTVSNIYGMARVLMFDTGTRKYVERTL